MTRDEIAETVAEEFDITKASAKELVKGVFNIMARELTGVGDRVDIAGFGKWEVKEAKERNGVNPKTGAKLVIAAHPKLSFKASKTLKDGLVG